MSVRPKRKSTNIQKRYVLDCEEAEENSRQTKTPQPAEIIVAPWPIEYETAGPTMCARDATKLKTAPVHQMMPPRVPQRCQLSGAAENPFMATGGWPSSGLRISR